MKFICVLTLFIIHIVHLNIAQHVAPGVPPQRYQQAPQHMPQQQVHPQQFQDVQMQQHQMQQQHMQQQQMPQQQQMYQQAPVQHVPVQQVPVGQVPVQHIPVQQGHHPHAHSAPQPGQLLNAANIQHEKEHIAEHMEVPIDTSKMTDQELQFHYFKMHDADNNNKLDGCELIKSLIHWHEQGNKDPTTQNTVENKIFKDDELIALIDPILKMDDLNADGFIDYPEFVRAQQKAASQVKSP